MPVSQSNTSNLLQPVTPQLPLFLQPAGSVPHPPPQFPHPILLSLTLQSYVDFELRALCCFLAGVHMTYRFDTGVIPRQLFVHIALDVKGGFF